MKAYALKQEYIRPEEYEFLHLVRDIFHRLKERSYEVSCHHLCHALVEAFPAIVVACDGYFGTGHVHSWLMLRDEHDGRIILDVYPVAGVDPFMINAHWITPWAKLYKGDFTVLNHVRQSDLEFDERVAELVVEIKEIVHQRAKDIVAKIKAIANEAPVCNT